MRGLTYRYSGREQQATLELERAENELRTQLKTTPEFEPALGALCLCLAALGKRTETEKMCAALLEKPIHDAMQIDETRYLVAMSLAMVNAHERALEVLTSLLSNPHYNDVAHLELDPAFISMRTEPRFIAMMNKYRTGSM